MRRILASLFVTAALVGAGAASPADAAVVPNSAFGCNGNVPCIEVNGTGLHVNWVEASTQINFTGHYRIYDDLAGWSSASNVESWIPRQFGGDPWHLTIDSNQPNNSKICVAAYNTSNTRIGNACETIHR